MNEEQLLQTNTLVALKKYVISHSNRNIVRLYTQSVRYFFCSYNVIKIIKDVLAFLSDDNTNNINNNSKNEGLFSK